MLQKDSRKKEKMAQHLTCALEEASDNPPLANCAKPIDSSAEDNDEHQSNGLLDTTRTRVHRLQSTGGHLALLLSAGLSGSSALPTLNWPGRLFSLGLAKHSRLFLSACSCATFSSAPESSWKKSKAPSSINKFSTITSFRQTEQKATPRTGTT